MNIAAAAWSVEHPSKVPVWCNSTVGLNHERDKSSHLSESTAAGGRNFFEKNPSLWPKAEISAWYGKSNLNEHYGSSVAEMTPVIVPSCVSRRKQIAAFAGATPMVA